LVLADESEWHLEVVALGRDHHILLRHHGFT
jgi:hypothetical protein